MASQPLGGYMARSDRQKLAKLLGHQEALIRQAFVRFVQEVRSAEVGTEIARFLRNRDLEGALRLVDGYIIKFSVVVQRAFQEAASVEATNQAQLLKPLVGARAVSFDPGNPLTVTLVRRNQLQFARAFSQEQRQATMRALSDALTAGTPPTQAVSAFRNSLGLNGMQERAVVNYRRLLETGNKEALEREARNKKFDRSVRNAQKKGEPLEAKQIDRMVDSYRAGLLAARSSTIARTEGLRITNQARAEAVRQVVDDLGVDRRRVIRIWNTTMDDRTRDSHASMDGQQVGIDEPFISGLGNRLMFPGDPSAPPEDIINCRCVITNMVN